MSQWEGTGSYGLANMSSHAGERVRGCEGARDRGSDDGQNRLRGGLTLGLGTCRVVSEERAPWGGSDRFAHDSVRHYIWPR